MKKFIKEFKEFISRGNVVDLSVAVIIGSAFSAIVTALTNKIIMPLINLILSLGGDGGLSSAFTFLKTVYNADGTIDLANSIYIDWGAFITAIINFFIIALTIFVLLKIINASHKKFKEFENIVIKETKKETIEAKKAMYIKAKSEDRPFKEVWAEYLEEKKKQQEEKARILKEAEEQQLQQERLNNPTELDLLKEIRDLLKDKNKK